MVAWTKRLPEAERKGRKGEYQLQGGVPDGFPEAGLVGSS